MEILPLSWYARVISCSGATPDLVLPAGGASSCNTPSHTSVNIKTSISGQCQNPSKLPNQCLQNAQYSPESKSKIQQNQNMHPMHLDKSHNFLVVLELDEWHHHSYHFLITNPNLKLCQDAFYRS